MVLNLLPDHIEWVEVYIRIKYDPYVLFLVKLKDKEQYYLSNTTNCIFDNRLHFVIRNFRKYSTAEKYLFNNYYQLIRGRI